MPYLVARRCAAGFAQFGSIGGSVSAFFPRLHGHRPGRDETRRVLSPINTLPIIHARDTVN